MDVERFLSEAAQRIIKVHEDWRIGADPTHRSRATNGGSGEPQFDFSGRQFDADACEIEIINGRNLHDNCRDLCASLARRGFTVQQIIDHVYALLLMCRDKRDAKTWQERVDYLPTLARSAVEKFPPRGGYSQSDTASRADAEPAPTIAYLNLRAWDQSEPKPIEYVVRDLIPARQVCLFSGHGASGKSTIALNLCCATVLGKAWLKSMPEFGPCMFIDGEEDEQVLHHRLYHNVMHYEVTFEQLASDGLHVAAMAGKDILMATIDRSGRVIPTRFYHLVLEQAADLKAKLVVLGPLANIFPGEENNRAQAQQFISLLTRIGIACGGAVLPIAHPSLTGITTGTGISGSTGWFNSVRAQMYLRTIDDKDEEQPDSDLRVLEFKKNQYGKLQEAMTLQWRRGLFLPITSASVEQLAREHKVNETLLALMRRFTTQHRPVSPNARSGSYAPEQFRPEPEATAIGATRKELEAAMRRLLASKAIEIRNFGKPSNPRPFLVLPTVTEPTEQ